MTPDSASHHERRLVERFRQGDRHALATLFEAHVDRVYAYAHHVLGRREDAEEVASEAFLRAFRRAADFRGDCPFLPWVIAIARNLCRDRLRQPRLLILPATGEEPGGEDWALRAEMAADVRAALAELPDDQRDALILCDADGWDAAEAASALGRSPAATRSLLYRARRALRDRLALRWKDAER